MPTDWQPIHSSTLVSAAAFDAAAERILVRLHSDEVRYYDECDADEWERFMATTTSKGEYLTQVLERKPGHGTLGRRDSSRHAPEGDIPRAVYLNAFRPAQELTDPKLFAGRHQQVRELADALQSAGSFPLIYGDRGLGKSSLALQAQLIAMGDDELLNLIGAAGHVLPDDAVFLTVFVTCSDSVRDLPELVQMLLNAAEDIVPASDESTSAKHLVDRSTRRMVSFKFFEAETTKSYVSKKERVNFESLSLVERLQRVVRLLNDTYGSPVLLIVDELDRLADKRGLASMVKALSSEDLKFLMVGIAQDWSDLILDHSSLERKISPIEVPRMARPDLAEIVDLATDALTSAGSSMSFTEEARKKLVDVSGGFPWFIHVLGQASLIATVEAGELVVTAQRVVTAMRDLVTNRFAKHFADLYQKAVRDSAQREMTLRTLAHWPASDVPTSRVYPILRDLGVSNPAVYRGHLGQPQYGPVIMSPGYQDRGLVRFRNEMFRQYVFLVPSLYIGVDNLVAEAVNTGSHRGGVRDLPGARRFA